MTEEERDREAERRRLNEKERERPRKEMEDERREGRWRGKKRRRNCSKERMNQSVGVQREKRQLLRADRESQRRVTQPSNAEDGGREASYMR